MNQATIDLEEPTKEDFEWMKDLIARFVKETDSIIGQRILDAWETERHEFIKVSFFPFFNT